MFSRFFIERPIFASVFSIIIVMAGWLSIESLPVEEYPQVVPPQVRVSAYYPGASAEVLAETVGYPLEQAINGVENMIYLTTTATAAGNLTLTASFKVGTDADQAATDVNNRVQSALSKLPEEVQRQGVTAIKRSNNILRVIGLYSKDRSMTPLEISNYASVNVLTDLKRVKGVGDVTIFGGQEYSLRIWLKPDLLAKYSLTPTDVIGLVREQNTQFGTGQIGQEPGADSLFTYTMTTAGRLSNPEAFGNIILRANSDGSLLRLRDVASVELGSQSYGFDATIDGYPGVPIGIFLQPDANALETGALLQEELQRIAKTFPSGLEYNTPYDTTKFVQVSIDEVIKTFIEAMALVALVVYLFLQNLRSAIIPLLAVPVSIIGTFAGMYLLGFSINLLTLFGLILAIGIVVDDAIIVIENIERIHRTERLPMKAAAIKAMEEVTAPVISIVLVLAAVFIPVSFMGGFTGQIYQQFAMTIVISVVISGIVALTLTPALCIIFLKDHPEEPFWIVKKFNDFFDFSTDLFTKGVGWMLKHAIISLILMIGMIGVTYDLFHRLPKTLVPSEDKGYIFFLNYLPPGSSLSRTREVRDEIVETVMKHPSVSHIAAFAGMDIATFGYKTDSGVAFVMLKDWEQRKDPRQAAGNLANQFTGMFYPNKEAFIIGANPPPISGMSLTGGFEMYVQSRVDSDYRKLGGYVQQIVAKASERPELTGVRSTLNMNSPQYELVLDREKAKTLGVQVSDVFDVIRATFGSYYVNDFNYEGRAYPVNIQSMAAYRANPENLADLFVRSKSGQMVPLASLVSFKRDVGANVVERYNLFPAAKITGEPKPGFSSGDAIRAIEEVSREVLPKGYSIDWTGSSYEEKMADSSKAQAFIFALIFVLLILAAQYERWLMPLAVMMAVPFAVFGATLATWGRGLSDDIYFQIGLVMLIALSAKNAILIIEFAMQKREEGLSIVAASLEGAKLRFRPIVMTSLAFTIGVIPLAISSGAGAASRHAIGTGVIGGMIAATTIAIFFIPLFYTLFERLNEKLEKWSSKGKRGVS